MRTRLQFRRLFPKCRRPFLPSHHPCHRCTRPRWGSSSCRRWCPRCCVRSRTTRLMDTPGPRCSRCHSCRSSPSRDRSWSTRRTGRPRCTSDSTESRSLHLLRLRRSPRHRPSWSRLRSQPHRLRPRRQQYRRPLRRHHQRPSSIRCRLESPPQATHRTPSAPCSPLVLQAQAASQPPSDACASTNAARRSPPGRCVTAPTNHCASSGERSRRSSAPRRDSSSTSRPAASRRRTAGLRRSPHHHRRSSTPSHHPSSSSASSSRTHRASRHTRAAENTRRGKRSSVPSLRTRRRTTGLLREREPSSHAEATRVTPNPAGARLQQGLSPPLIRGSVTRSAHDDADMHRPPCRSGTAALSVDVTAAHGRRERNAFASGRNASGVSRNGACPASKCTTFTPGIASTASRLRLH